MDKTTALPTDLQAFAAGPAKDILIGMKGSDKLVPFPHDLAHASKAEQDAFRERMKATMECKIDGCTREVTAAFSTKIQSYYKHVAGTNDERDHEPESYWHQLAKIVIVAWAKDHPAVAKVEAEKPSEDGLRRPDVTITTHSGTRIAVEIQYSAMTEAQFHERDRELADRYDVRVWLLGHQGENLKIRNRGTTIKLDGLPRVILDTAIKAERGRCTLAWINPEQQRLMTVWDSATAGTVQPVRGNDTTGLQVSSLTQCEITDHSGIRTVGQEALDTARALRVARDGEESVKAGELRVIEERLLADQRRREARERRKQGVESPRATKRRRQGAYRNSGLAAWRQQMRADGRVIDLGATTPEEEKFANIVDMTVEHWKSHTVRFIMRVPEATPWTTLCAEITSGIPRDREISGDLWDAYRRFVRTMSEAGLIWCGNGDRPWVGPRFPHR